MSVRKHAGQALRGLLVASTVAAAVQLGAGSPAHAVTVAEAKAVITAASTAYDLYQRFFNGALTLDEATDKIIDAIGAAETSIMAHVDAIAAANVQACTRSAVIDLADLEVMSPDTVQEFARDATACVTLAEGLINAASDQAVINQLTFAVNTVGPIALVVRTRAGFTTAALRSTLVAVNESAIIRLTPNCTATPYWGDSQNGLVEVELRCAAFNGQRGYDWVFKRLTRGKPLPAFDYTTPINLAMDATTYELAKRVLPWLYVV